ncbi:hypothetical protein KR074_002475 [Drosophila pseudoananassae]|nr:hypothetical protein KR074_002475 [Drosophila pseudoananassae]
MKSSPDLVLALLLLACLVLPSRSSSPRNLTAFLGHRQKRWLIYQNSGSMKFSIGPSLPIPLEDKVSFRSCVLSFTIQGGTYNLPTSPIWPWDKWEGTFARSLTQMRKNIEWHTAGGGVQYADDARLVVYTALEEYIGRRNNDQDMGRKCLLRSICENAQIHHHVGVFSEIMDIVLSPGKAELDECYHDAYAAGRAGSDCLDLYRTCPRGSNFLDELLIVEDD